MLCLENVSAINLRCKRIHVLFLTKKVENAYLLGKIMHTLISQPSKLFEEAMKR